MDELMAAALAVCDRWDSPDWKDGTHTGEYIRRLREAVSKIESEVRPVYVGAEPVYVEAEIEWKL